MEMDIKNDTLVLMMIKGAIFDFILKIFETLNQKTSTWIRQMLWRFLRNLASSIVTHVTEGKQHSVEILFIKLKVKVEFMTIRKRA